MDFRDLVLEKIDDLPTLPTIYSALTDAMANPRSTAADLAGIITQDQAATAKILKTVNSSLYGLQKKIDTITQAIFHLGFNEIKNLVIAMSVINLFSGTKAFTHFSLIDLWKHSIGVGVISRNLGKVYKIANIENFFLAGILHDIGKLIFLKYFSKEYSEVLKCISGKDITIHDAEIEVLGISHETLGEMLANKWRLPVSIRNSIRHHKTGLVNGSVDTEVSCVHLANIMARLLELGYAGDNFVHQPNIEIWKVLFLPKEAFVKLLPAIQTDFEQSMAVFQLDSV